MTLGTTVFLTLRVRRVITRHPAAVSAARSGGTMSAPVAPPSLSRRVRMNRIAYLGLIALLGACGGVAATPSPTDAPSATPAPTATAAPTPTAEPTYTTGDQRVDDTIRNAFAELSGYAEALTRATDVYAMEKIFQDMGSLAGSQQLVALSLQPSVCTKAALDLWVDAMRRTEAVADKWLDLWENGGDFSNYTTDDANAAGRKAGEALSALNNSACR